jgi:hypothetical protein
MNFILNRDTQLFGLAYLIYWSIPNISGLLFNS